MLPLRNLSRDDFYVYVDEAGSVKDKYYIVVAIALTKKLRALDLIEITNDDKIKRYIESLLNKKGEIKGHFIFNEILKSNDSIRRTFVDWLTSIFDTQVVTTRVSVIGTQEYYSLTEKSITSGLSTLVHAGMLFRKNKNKALEEIHSFLMDNYGILHYLSSLSIEDIVGWLVNLRVPRQKTSANRPAYIQSLQYKILRLQGLHEVIPKVIRDLVEGGQFIKVNVYIDKDSQTSDSIYWQYVHQLLPQVVLDAKTVPDEIGSAIVGKVSYNAKVIESHCNRIKGGTTTSSCNNCTGDCPGGIWLADIIAHMFYLCINEQQEDVCKMLEELCKHVRDRREKSFTVFVIPREVRDSLKYTPISGCIWGTQH